MVIVDIGTRRWPEKIVFFPNGSELSKLAAKIGFREHLSIMTTEGMIDKHPHLIKREVLTTTCIDLRDNLDMIYAKIGKNCRVKIQKAKKFESSILIVNNTPAAYADFLKLYGKIAHAKGLSGLSKDELTRGYAAISDCRVLYMENTPICSHVTIRDRSTKRVRMKFSASARLESKELATLAGVMNRYLHWKEIQEYKSEGFSTYDFGGIGDKPEWLAIKQFKLSFGGYIEDRNSYIFEGKVRRLWDRIYWRPRSRLARSAIISQFRQAPKQPTGGELTTDSE